MSTLQEFCAATKDYCQPGIPGTSGKPYTVSALICFYSSFTGLTGAGVYSLSFVCITSSALAETPHDAMTACHN